MARSDILPEGEELFLTLDRYQEILGFPEAAFNGLHKAGDETCASCGAIWNQTDRDKLAVAIKQAEDKRVQELGYNLAPTYVEDEVQPYTVPMILDEKYLVQIGTRKESDISLAHPTGITGTDLVTLAVATSVTSPEEIAVYYPNEDVRIWPKSVTIAGGIATIVIPLARLVDPDVLSCATPPEYTDLTNYLTTVDIKRVYYDESDAVTLEWLCGCDTSCCTGSGATQTGYVSRYNNKRLSIVEVCAGTYSSGSWTKTSFSNCRVPDQVRLNYMAGIKSSMQIEMDTARLANLLLSAIVPDSQSMCQQCFPNDRLVDEGNNIMTPYGNQVGAVQIWLADSRAKIGIGGKFPRVG